MTIDPLILGFDRALRTLSGIASSARPNPAANAVDGPLTPEERHHAAGLMRVNHTGEVCAQALYEAQAIAARNADARSRFLQAAREEEDHLAWTQERLAELGGRTSFVNPLWYAGSFAIGICAILFFRSSALTASAVLGSVNEKNSRSCTLTRSQGGLPITHEKPPGARSPKTAGNVFFQSSAFGSTVGSETRR